MQFCAVDTFQNQIFAEKSWLNRKTQRTRPEIEIDGAHGVDRLIRPAVMFTIADSVADDALRIHHHRALHGMFENTRLRRLPGKAFASPRHTARIFMDCPSRFMIPVSRFMQ